MVLQGLPHSFRQRHLLQSVPKVACLGEGLRLSFPRLAKGSHVSTKPGEPLKTLQTSSPADISAQ